MSFRLFAFAFLAALLSTATASAQDAPALDISTHVLDIANGVGGGGVPVTLEHWDDSAWQMVGRTMSEDNGRVESFTPEGTPSPGAGMYRLTFDMSDYWDGAATRTRGDGTSVGAFFPEIIVVFQIADPSVHTHVPVLVSPYGYSTYRGN